MNYISMNIKFQCFTVTSSTKMNLHCASLAATISSVCSINEATHKSRTLQKRVNSDAPIKLSTEFLSHDSLEPTTKPCFCGRRHFIEAATLGTTLFPIQPSRATNPPREYTVITFLPLTHMTEKRKACILSSNSCQKLMLLMT